MSEVLHINKLERDSSGIYTLLTERIKKIELYSTIQNSKERDFMLTSLSLYSRKK